MRRRSGTTASDPLARLRAMDPKRTLQGLVRSFAEHDLLTYASAISFQAFFALIPLSLTALAILGAINLGDIWSRDLAPHVRPQVSGAVYAVIDSTVRQVLGARQGFWVTFGAVLTVWEVSGAMRAVMTVLDRIYRVQRQRVWRERYTVSIALSALVIVLLLAAGGVMIAGRLVDGWVTGVLRWPVAAGLLLLAVGSVLRWGPAGERHWRWVSFGTGIVAVSWLVMSAGFGFYLGNVAEYGTIFGNLATLIIMLEYLYLSAIVFVGGLALDGLAQAG